MKKLNKLALLVASATMAMAVTSVASAQTATDEDNWKNTDGQLVWRIGDGSLCWRNNFWTPGTANPECDGAIAAAVETPVAKPADPKTPTKQIQDETVVLQADALFDFDKSVLKPAGKQALDQLVADLSQLDYVETIVAVGHTDSIGKDAYNQKLSERRAEAVKAYLVSKGIPADTVFTEGKSFHEPVATNKTREGRALNRRVEVEIVGTKEVEVTR